MYINSANVVEPGVGTMVVVNDGYFVHPTHTHTHFTYIYIYALYTCSIYPATLTRRWDAGAGRHMVRILT